MRKYWLVFKNSLASNLEYRSNVFAFFLAELFSFGVMVYLWFSIYRQGEKLGGYDLASIVIYYAFSKLIMLIVQSQDIARQIDLYIREGEIINYLIKPINFLFKELFYSLGKSVFRFLIYFFIFLIIIFFGRNFYDFNLFNLLYFSLSLFMSFLVFYLSFFIIGVLAFYIGWIQGVNLVMAGIINFMSGYLVPLDLFPPYLFNLFNVLPFKFITFVPISIALGKMEGGEIIKSYLLGTFWIILLYITAVILYKKGLKRYEAFGS